MNWTPDRLLAARGRQLVDRVGAALVARLYPDGWEVRRGGDLLATAADVWSACRVLNDLDATSDAQETA